jgi:hypothetical protein
MMSETARHWRRGCGIGCVVILGLSVLLIGGGSLILMGPFRNAIETRQALVEQFGEDEDFTPTADGSIPAPRLEAFLQVREAVFATCGVLAEAHSHFEAMEQFDDQEEVDKGEVMKAAWQSVKAAMGMGPKMGHFFEVRNNALMTAGMGLGEYSYIYAVAYGSRTLALDQDATLLGGSFTRRVHHLLRKILQNQLDLMDAEGERWLDTEERYLLKEEIDRLIEVDDALPWSGGVPPALAASLAPYEERLVALFCPDTVGMELIRNKKMAKGIGIRGD